MYQPAAGEPRKPKPFDCIEMKAAIHSMSMATFARKRVRRLPGGYPDCCFRLLAPPSPPGAKPRIASLHREYSGGGQ